MEDRETRMAQTLGGPGYSDPLKMDGLGQTSAPVSATPREISAAVRRGSRKPVEQDPPADTSADFTESHVPLQIKVPSDLVTSLKLHSFQSGESMSAIALRCMTTPEVLRKAWISTRKAG